LLFRFPLPGKTRYSRSKILSGFPPCLRFTRHYRFESGCKSSTSSLTLQIILNLFLMFFQQKFHHAESQRIVVVKRVNPSQKRQNISTFFRQSNNKFHLAHKSRLNEPH